MARSLDASAPRAPLGRSAARSAETRSACSIPCHRVIAADGTIGGYGGDAWGGREEQLALKRELLLREGVTVAAPSR